MLLLIIIVRLFQLMIFLRVILSWIPESMGTPLYRWLVQYTEPALKPVRNSLKGLTGDIPVDFSPFVVLLLLHIIIQLLY